MDEEKINVLHVTPDDKFFDSVIQRWEGDENFNNKAIFISKNKNHIFRYIKSVDKVEHLWSKDMVKKRFFRNDYDVIFLHSFPCELWEYIKFIPSDRIVIWWMWGLEVYNSSYGLPPYIDIDLIKPLTKAYKESFRLRFIKSMKKCIFYMIRYEMSKKRDYVLSRIDYFQPVVKLEFSMMQKLSNFRAKEFYYKPASLYYEEVCVKNQSGNILLGNSSTLTNNHLDVLQYALRFKQSKQKIIMPLSYGNMDYKMWLKGQITNPDIITLEDYLSRKEYYKVLETCSYAIIGTIRQQAMGNILYFLRHGIKLFLYKDSIAYKNHKKLGYVIYPIEEMTSESLSTPLTKEEIEQNIKVSIEDNSCQKTVYDECVKEIKAFCQKRRDTVI